VHIGITGHRSLPDEAMWAWVAAELDALLDPPLDSVLDPPLDPLLDPGTAVGTERLVGVTGLAAGADSVFAARVLAHGGTLHVVLAYEGFERSLASDDERDALARLLARAETVETLSRRSSDEEAYLAEGHRVVDLSDLLVAVWDGEAARGRGGTGDVVAYAVDHGTAVLHLDPFHERAARLDGGA
jgi:hypothetical protein